MPFRPINQHPLRRQIDPQSFRSELDHYAHPPRPRPGWPGVIEAVQCFANPVTLIWQDRAYPLVSNQADHLPYSEGAIIALVASDTEARKNVDLLNDRISRFDFYWTVFSGVQRESITITIDNRLGLHTRASAKFTKVAKSFRSIIAVSRRNFLGSVMNANAKSIMAVASLAAGRGSSIEVRAMGSDAPEAVFELAKLVKLQFGEGE